jgi:hypothetical protein
MLKQYKTTKEWITLYTDGKKLCLMLVTNMNKFWQMLDNQIYLRTTGLQVTND